MSARFILGDSRITPKPMTVATAQAVEVCDIVGLLANTIVRASDSASTTIPTAAGTALTVNEIYKRSGPGVVQITSTVGGSSSGSGQAQPSGSSLGSGFVIDTEGHIVTNYHVIDGATSIKVRFSTSTPIRTR